MHIVIAFSIVCSIAHGFVGMTETKPNRGYWIDRFNQSVGAPMGSAWCASSVSFIVDSAQRLAHARGWKLRFIPTRSPMAIRFILPNSVRAEIVLLGRTTIGAGDLAIWRTRDGYGKETIRGHIGVVERIVGIGKEQKIYTLEGNTSRGEQGSQRDGGGYYARVRTIQPFNRFRITHFTRTMIHE